MAAKIVPNTRSRGITPGPKLAASPTIHSRMANVKIVQNTALLLNGMSPKSQAARFTVVGPERPFRSWALIRQDPRIGYPAYSSDPK